MGTSRFGIRAAIGRVIGSARDAARGAPTGSVEVAFVDDEGQEHRVRGQAGDRLLDLARAGRVDLSHYCGGQASCGTCRVDVLDGAGLDPIGPREQLVLGDAAARRGARLACQARAIGAARVRVPSDFGR
jgi:2Fe-2S ferredoxin